MDTRQGERSLGDLFADLTRDMSSLIRQEAQLATTEMTQKAVTAGRHAGVLAAGGLVAYAGFFALLWAIVYGLTTLFAMPLWLSSLIVATIALAVGGLMVWRGIDALKKTDLLPRQTVETLKEDAQWAKDQTA